MDEEMLAAAGRIRDSMGPGASQRQLAQQIGMTPDALSRALNGQRGFSMRELIRIADTLNVDLTWLLTGRPDPHRMTFAARHLWHEGVRARSNPGQRADGEVLEKITSLYASALPDGPSAGTALPAGPAQVRLALGQDFVRHFAEHVESRLGVDVVRIPDVTTDYSLRIGQRGVIVLNTTPNWFRSNWSLAHELGHLALGHHADGPSTDIAEAQANRFAADLLLPPELLEAQTWSAITEPMMADFLWSTGVSTSALRTRLAALSIDVAPAAASALEGSTSVILRQFGRGIDRERVVHRQQASSARRFPLGLLDHLTAAVESGRASPDGLAWALDVPVDDIDFPEPDEATASRTYERMLADRPALGELLAGVSRP